MKTNLFIKTFAALTLGLSLCTTAARAQDADAKYAGTLIAEGKEAPEIALRTPEGKMMRLSSLRGQYVVVDFMASWCGDCMRDLPEMKRIYGKFHSRGVEFFSVSFDTDKAAWKGMIERNGITWPQVSELKKWKETKVSAAYGVKWIPSMILLDKEGKVVLRTVLKDKLEKKLTELLPEGHQRQVLTTDTMIAGSKGRIACTVQRPADVSGRMPVAIVMHGFTSHRNDGLIRLIADTLLQRGIATVRFDFDGHGESGGKFVEMTVPTEIDDAKKVYAFAAGLPFAGKVALVGHSQGGVVTAMTAGELGAEKVSAVVLLAPAAVLRDDAIRGNSMGAVYDPLDPPDSVPLYGGRLHLGRDYILTAFSLPIYETAARYTGPAAIIHGTGDRIVPYTYGERFHTTWQGSRMYLLPGFDHGFSQDPYRAAEIAGQFLSGTLQTR